MKKDVLALAHTLGQQLIDKRGRDFGNNVASFGVVYEPDKIAVNPSTACYVTLHGGSPEHSLAVVSQIRSDLTKEETLAYVHWLLNVSPYAHTFAMKDAAECVSQGYLVSDSYTDQDFLVAGLVSSRRLWEYTTVACAWFDLVQRGCEPNMAFWLAHKVSGSRLRSDSVSVGKYGSGHKSIYTSRFNKAGLNAWCRGEPPPGHVPRPYHDTNRYGEYSSMYSGDAVSTYDNIVSQAIDYNGGASTSLMPFKKPKARADTLCWGEAMRQLVERALPKLEKALA